MNEYGQKGNLFPVMTAGSCSPPLAGSPLISCIYSIHFWFCLAYALNPLMSINMMASLGTVLPENFTHYILIESLKGRVQENIRFLRYSG